MRIKFASLNSDLAPADNLASACFWTLRFMPERIRRRLHKSGLWEDLVQEIYLTAWQAYREELDRTQTLRLMGKRIRGFLKAYGYRLYRSSYIRTEVPYEEAFPWDIFDKGIPEPCQTPRPFAGKDGLGDRILELLQRRPEGLPRRKIAGMLGVSVSEVSHYVAPLIKSGKVISVERANWRGAPCTPLLFSPDAPLPAPIRTRAEVTARVLHAYFVEEKAIQRIAREHRHSRGVVRRLVREAEAAGWQRPCQVQEVAVR